MGFAIFIIRLRNLAISVQPEKTRTIAKTKTLNTVIALNGKKKQKNKKIKNVNALSKIKGN